MGEILRTATENQEDFLVLLKTYLDVVFLHPLLLN